ERESNSTSLAIDFSDWSITKKLSIENKLTTIFAAHPQQTTFSFWNFLLYIDNSDPKRLEKRLGKRLKTKESLLDPKMRERATEAAQKLLYNLAVAQLGALEDQRKQPFLLTGIQLSALSDYSGQGYATDILSLRFKMHIMLGCDWINNRKG
ncbi:hypothetical protein ACJX0J_042048, partial [Zea mays]